MQHYIFVVQAQDTGRPSLSSTVTVYFNVLDLNDNSPLFDPMSYSDELYENVTVGSSVITVSATDQDSGMHPSFTFCYICSLYNVWVSSTIGIHNCIILSTLQETMEDSSTVL